MIQQSTKDRATVIQSALTRNWFGTSHATDGKWSWFVCICGMAANTIVLGSLGSFGVLFPALLDEFKAGKWKTALMGSLGMSFTFFCGPLVGKMCERFGCRAVTIFGAILLIAGYVTSSQSPSIYVLFLTYSIIVAFGICCVYTSVFLMVPKYFTKGRFLATGLIAAGPGAGVFMMTPIVQLCLDTLGWRGTFLAMAGIVSPICFLACSFDPDVNSPLLSKSLNCEPADSNVRIPARAWWRNSKWLVYTLSTAILSFGNPVPQVHMVSYCVELGISPDDASKLYINFGVCSLLSRVLTGKLLDVGHSTKTTCMHPHYVYVISVLILGLSTVLCPLISSYVWLMGYFGIYGLAEGTFSTSINVLILSSVLEDKDRGKAYGFWLMGFSVPMSLGPPVAGFMADSFHSYAPAFYMAGCVVILSGLIVIPLRCCITRKRTDFV